MAKTVTFVSPSGAEQTIAILPGLTVMESAVQGGVDGIEGECGGVCACGTCHVVVAQACYDALGRPAEMEEDMLDGVPGRQPTSRLCCQISASDLGAVTVMTVPDAQGL